MKQFAIRRALARRWRAVALLVASATLGHSAAAQQDTTKHPMPGMPRMPGMTMPSPRKSKAAPAPRKSAAHKPAAHKPAAHKPAPHKPAPHKPVPHPPAAASHEPAASAMPGMTMPAARHDTTMKGMDMPGMHAMPAKGTPDTASMRGMDMRHDTTGGGMAGMHDMHAMGDIHDMTGMHMMTPDPLGVSMDRMGSGTTWVPDAAPIPSLYFAAPGGWDVTGHGFAFLQYDQQGGDRGAHQVGSLNWMMLMASHALAGGRFQARTMLSLDAVTVTPRGYPLLLQSGETYDGTPLHDRQHPHDLFMELSALYERPVTRSLGVMLYAAPSGEPALGPVAFMHRPSAMDIPTAPITHHWADATHISFGVLTAGLFTHTLKVEGSWFNGREPDQHRLDFDPIRLDSWSGRATLNPSSQWSLSAGYGYLKSPEALDPGMSMHRVTASVLHGVTLGTDGQLASSIVYGANRHSTHPGLSHSLLAESEAVLDTRNTVFVRAEAVQKSAEDLSLDAIAFAPEQRFNVGELSLGYIRDFARFGRGTLGLGAMGTVNVVPSALETTYGSRTPLGLFVFLRARPFRTGMNMSASSPAH